MFNIIIDDACHDIWDQIRALKIYLPLLKQGGIYVIEDVQQNHWPDALDQLYNSLPEEFKSKSTKLDLRHFKNRPDDSLFVIEN